jgi:zinc protease
VKNKFLVLALTASLFFSLVGDASAQGGRKRKTKPAQAQNTTSDIKQPPKRLPQAQLFNKKLANGFEIIVYEDHAVPLVTIELAARNGSFTEPPELNGLSHLYEHLFFKTNQVIARCRGNINAEECAHLRDIDKLGVSNNGVTREEIVEYYFTSNSRNLETIMRFMSDAVRYPLFDEYEFEIEKKVVISELERIESNPYYPLQREMNQRLFYKYPSRKQPGGDRETVAKATTDQMRLIQGRYYVPNNCALVVAGDVNVEEVFRLAEKFYGSWKPSDTDPFVKFPLAEHPSLPKNEAAVLNAPVENVVIQIGWHGPSIGKDNAATYAADVFSFILRQPDSRFQKALVDTGLVTGVGFNYYTQRNVGPITLIAQTTPEKARAATKAIYAEIAKFNDKDYFTDEQLESAKTLLESDDLFSREKVSEYTHTIGFWWSSTGLDYFRGYLDNLRATKREDISRYVTTYIHKNPRVTLVLLSDESQAQIKLKPEELVGP